MHIQTLTLNSTCEARFMFTADGYIQAAIETDAIAQKMSDVLQLDTPKLRDLRGSAIAPFLTDEELRLFVKGYLAEDVSRQYGEFWTTIRALFGGLV